jgi:hypothetical protein
MSEETQPPVLFNCTGRPKYIVVGTMVVKLPTGPKPVLVDMLGDRGELVVRAGLHGDGSATLEVASGEVTSTLSMPPVMPGAMFLVDAEVLLRCPERDDLVTPAYYAWINPEGLDLSEFDESDDELGVFRDEQDDDRRISVLSGVSAHLGQVGADTPNQML